MNYIMLQKYFVLRLGHRKARDKRLTTHTALIARAFGSRGFFYTGDKDNVMEKSILNLSNSEWGGKENFYIEYWDDWLLNLKSLIKKGIILIHLTMYGDKIQNVQEKIFELYQIENKNIIICIGGAKVPDLLYRVSHFNISVTNQPHSEAGALAVALDRIFKESINTTFDSEN